MHQSACNWRVLGPGACLSSVITEQLTSNCWKTSCNSCSQTTWGWHRAAHASTPCVCETLYDVSPTHTKLYFNLNCKAYCSALSTGSVPQQHAIGLVVLSGALTSLSVLFSRACLVFSPWQSPDGPRCQRSAGQAACQNLSRNCLPVTAGPPTQTPTGSARQMQQGYLPKT